KSFVFPVVQLGDPDGAAEVEPVVMTPDAVFAVDGGIAGVQYLVHGVVVNPAMVLIRSRLHGDVKQRAGNRPVFRGEIAGLYRDFLNRLRAGLCPRGDGGERLT